MKSGYVYSTVLYINASIFIRISGNAYLLLECSFLVYFDCAAHTGAVDELGVGNSIAIYFNQASFRLTYLSPA